MKIIERWKKSLYRKAVKHRLIAPQVIVLMDGGVCSQMHQYLLGRIFENGGHKVLYDLSFYEEWGTDMDYQFVRNFDLLKAFPYLKVKSASNWLCLSIRRNILIWVIILMVGRMTSLFYKEASGLFRWLLSCSG